jgi:gliding motility-associated-like protein
MITQPTAYCAWEGSVTAFTIPIRGAQSYEWEILHNGQSTFFTTITAELEISITDMGLVDDFDIRVRGVNEFGKGGFSNTHTVKMENPPNNPILLATCTDIYLEEPGYQIKWYYNDQLLSEYDVTQERITPHSAGIYYATTNNSCGAFASNSITFGPLEPESVFIPNIVTPNNDGNNDFFFIDEKLESPVLEIFNRWGDQVYYSKQYANEWSGDQLSVGVYYFKLTSNCISHPIQGSLTVRK